MKDGVDHINIYSKGETELGRLLTNFAHTPFTVEDGEFASVEAYWYWLLAVEKYKGTVHQFVVELIKLRDLYGYQAKKLGREIVGERFDELDTSLWFQTKILKAFYAKIEAHPQIAELLKDSTLPFQHYYVFVGRKVEPTSHKWQLKYWERIRRQLKEGVLF
jgi:predicted NAD-dependent protein-ADP-ribosyltransferase YbiA (DUF1768 family)